MEKTRDWEVRKTRDWEVRKTAEVVESNDTPKGLSEEEKSIMRSKATRYPIYDSPLMSEVISTLVELNKKWRNCYIDFWGWDKRLYSVDINTEDDAYLQLYWKTKIEQEKEWARHEQKRELERKQEEMKAIEKIPWWIEEGKKYIDESKWEDWEKYVNGSARAVYFWTDIDYTLELLKLIDAWESWEKVQKAFDDQDHSVYSYSVVFNRVVYFSKKWEKASENLKESS